MGTRQLAGDSESPVRYHAKCGCGFEETGATRYVECPHEADDNSHAHDDFSCAEVQSSPPTASPVSEG